MKEEDQDKPTKNVNYTNNGQVAAFGENARAENITMTWNGKSHEIDVQALAVELSKLHEKLNAQAENADHLEATKKVGDAAEEAKHGRAEKAFEFLSKAGTWVLEVAKGIGVPVAIKALEVAMGI